MDNRAVSDKLFNPHISLQPLDNESDAELRQRRIAWREADPFQLMGLTRSEIEARASAIDRDIDRLDKLARNIMVGLVALAGLFVVLAACATPGYA